MTQFNFRKTKKGTKRALHHPQYPELTLEH